MRVSREDAARTRQTILRTAGRLFRRRGFDGVGVAEIMAEGGLSHGGFYRHFASKDALAVEAADRVASRTVEDWQEVRDKAQGDALTVLLDRYLTPSHRDTPDAGCLFAALGADVGRSDDAALHAAVAGGVRQIADLLADLGPEDDDAARREAALGRLSTLVGALILARATRGDALSDEILSAARLWLDGRGGDV